MKRLIYAAIIAGTAFGLALGVHELLVAAAQGDSGWSARAAATCAGCHGE